MSEFEEMCKKANVNPGALCDTVLTRHMKEEKEMKESEMFRVNRILEANKKKAKQVKIEELSHTIAFYFKKDSREFRLSIEVNRDSEGKIELEEQNDDQPILIASTNTNWVLYEKLLDRARNTLFNICALADELANEYIK